MNSLSRRITALEQKATILRPLRIDDETIVETLNEGRADPGLLIGVIDALFSRIYAAMVASVVKGHAARAYCLGRGIERRLPEGPLDLLAATDPIRSPLRVSNAAEEAWAESTREVSDLLKNLRKGVASTATNEQVREILVVMLSEKLGDRSSLPPGRPVLSDSEASRLLRLVEPIEPGPSTDLPLLVWNDCEGHIKTSWPGSPMDLWTPVDVGMEHPGYVFSPPSKFDDSVGVESRCLRYMEPLKRVPPALNPPPITDEELIVRLTDTGPPFVRGLPDLIDTLFLHIEPYLRASVLVGAEALRISRSRGHTQPIPQTAVNQAATIVSYREIADMPATVLEACSWAIPGTELFDDLEPNWRIARFTVGSVRGDLVLKLLDRDGIFALRETPLSDDLLPKPRPEEVARLLRLVEPLCWNPDPDLPLLVWRDHDGAASSSWVAKTGQIRSVADMSGLRQSQLPLADPSVVDYVAMGEMFECDHYRP